MEVPQTDDKWLWVDPFAGDDHLTSGAALLAEAIKRYVIEYNVLINREDFNAGEQLGAKLKGASYTMSPDPAGAWTFEGEEEEKTQVVLYPKQEAGDLNGRFYLVKKHSLVYIKLRQELRIPYYFIGRHNLKITYVYQGLLLGTGPQVDPGYVGHLIIPLHNLTTRDVRIYVDKSFVSVDFVRTTPMHFDQGDPKTLEELYEKYKEPKALLEPYKVQRRRELRDYLEGKTPQSAMGGVLRQYSEISTKYETTAREVASVREKINDDLKGIRRIEWLAVIAIVITFFGAVYGVVWGVRAYYGDIVTKQFDLQAQIAKVREEKEQLRSEQTRAVQDLRGQIAQICKQLASARGGKLIAGPCP